MYADNTYEFDVSKESSFRDLGKPVGALAADKLEQSKSKYFELINKQATPDKSGSGLLQDKPYMYLAHYSTPGIVFYYLIR